MKILIILIFALLSTSANAEMTQQQIKTEKTQALLAYNDKLASNFDQTRAITIFEKYSNNDSLMLYYFGLANYESKSNLLNLDKDKGLLIIERAAIQGLALAQYKYSTILLNNNNYKRSLSFLKKAASKHNKDAQYTLGKMYYIGSGIELNKKKGFNLLLKAAIKNNEKAQYDLAKIYFSQREERLQKQGVIWLKKSVKNGNFEACEELYKLYMSGLLVEKNIKEHLKYLECSANQKNRDAQLLLATYLIDGKYIPQNKEHAGKILYFLADDGDSEASVQYWRYVLNFYPYDKSRIATSILFLEKTYKDSIDASLVLGSIYQYGTYKKQKNIKDAIKYYQNAKELGSDEATEKLINLFK